MILKLAHLSDCHLGYKSGKKVTKEQINIREQDGYDAFNEAIDGIIKEKVDIVVIAGDLFHSPKPSTKTIIETLKSLRKLSNAKIPCYIITGNHDTNDIVYDNSASVIVNLPELNIFSYEEPLKVIDLDKVKLWLISHHNFNEQDETFKKLNPKKEDFNILVTHGSCYDDNLGLILHTEGEPREVVIPEKVMAMNWDYTLLGHIHTRKWVSSKNPLKDSKNRKQFYNGSLLRRGFSDEESPLGRGWTLWNIDTDKKEMIPKFFNVWQRPQFEKIINCSDKKINDIFFEIESFLKEVTKEDLPIVRIILKNIKHSKQKTLNTSHLKELTDKCLTFSITYKREEDLEVFSQNYNKNFSNNLLNAYELFWEKEKENISKDIQEKTKEKTINYIKEALKNA